MAKKKLTQRFIVVDDIDKTRFLLAMERHGFKCGHPDYLKHFNSSGDRGVYLMSNKTWQSHKNYDNISEYLKTNAKSYPIIYMEDLGLDDSKYINQKEINSYKKEMSKYA